MIRSINKARISKEYGYALKTSQLEEIVEKYEIKIDIDLDLWKPQIIKSIFEAHFWLPNENNSTNRLYIRAGCVLVKDLPLARVALVEEIVPEFIKWIKQIESVDSTSTFYKEHFFNACFIDNKVSIFFN